MNLEIQTPPKLNQEEVNNINISITNDTEIAIKNFPAKYVHDQMNSPDILSDIKRRSITIPS